MKSCGNQAEKGDNFEVNYGICINVSRLIKKVVNFSRTHWARCLLQTLLRRRLCSDGCIHYTRNTAGAVGHPFTTDGCHGLAGC